MCRADVECAIDYSLNPAIRYPPDGRPVAANDNLPSHAEKAEQRAESTPITSLLIEPVATIAGDFMAVVRYLNEQIDQGQLLDPFVLDDSVLCLQHRLASCNLALLGPLDRAYRASCLIFIKCLIRPLRVVARTSNPLVAQIQLNIGSVEETPKALLIWILFMGLIGGGPLQEDRIRISSKIVDLLKYGSQTFPSWEEVKKQLQQVAWVPAVLDDVGQEIWAELDAVALV